MTQNAASGIVAAILADQANTLTQQASLTLPADGEVLSGVFGLIVKAVQEGQTGTGAFSPLRVATAVTNIPATAVTAGTPVSLVTPAAGKKFRVLGWAFSLSVAGSVLLKDAGSEFLRTPLMAAGVGLVSPAMGQGFLSAAANNVLGLDVSATGSVSGFVLTMQE